LAQHSTLKDRVGAMYIKSRLDRIANGNLGDYKFIGDGVYEIKIHYGPGYRVYFSEHGLTILLLLAGGSKQSQEKDIINAKKYLHEFLLRHQELDDGR